MRFCVIPSPKNKLNFEVVLFSEFHESDRAQISTSIMSICSYENIRKIVKLSSREFPHYKIAKIIVNNSSVLSVELWYRYPMHDDCIIVFTLFTTLVHYSIMHTQ